MVSLLERLHQASAELATRDADPLRGMVEATVRGMEAVSTIALLDLIGLPTTTGNARRVSQTMRALGFVPIKSRRLMPGGYRDTVTRGWTRPVRELRNLPPAMKPTGRSRCEPMWGETHLRQVEPFSVWKYEDINADEAS